MRTLARNSDNFKLLTAYLASLLVVALAIFVPVYAGSGTDTITNAVDNGDGSYTLTVSDSSGMTAGDHFGALVAAGTSGVYEVISKPSGTSVIISDTQTEENGGSAFGVPVNGSCWYGTPSANAELSLPPDGARGYAAAARRDNYISDIRPSAAEMSWGGDTYFGRDAAGALYVGATTATGDGTIVASSIENDGGGEHFDMPVGNLQVHEGSAQWGGWTSGRFYALDDKRITFGTGSDVYVQGELGSLTDNTATTVMTLAMGDGTVAGVTLVYTVEVVDGTDLQVEHGDAHGAFYDTSGGASGGFSKGQNAQVVTTGSLSVAFSVDTTDDGNLEIQVNANSSLTTPTITIRWYAVVPANVSRSLTLP